MPTIVRVLATAFVLGALGCSSTSQPSAALATSQVVPLTDVRSLAGQWGGLVKGRPGAREDYIELTITESGRYSIVTQRQIGTASDKGTLLVQDGRAVMQSENQRAGVLQLLRDAEGHLALRLDGAIDPLRPISAVLTPATR